MNPQGVIPDRTVLAWSAAICFVVAGAVAVWWAW